MSTPAVGASTPAGGLVRGYSVHHGVCYYRSLMHCKEPRAEPPSSTPAVGASTAAGVWCEVTQCITACVITTV